MKVNILDYIDKMQVMYGDKDPSSMAQEPRNMADGGRIEFKDGTPVKFDDTRVKIPTGNFVGEGRDKSQIFKIKNTKTGTVRYTTTGAGGGKKKLYKSVKELKDAKLESLPDEFFVQSKTALKDGIKEVTYKNRKTGETKVFYKPRVGPDKATIPGKGAETKKEAQKFIDNYFKENPKQIRVRDPEKNYITKDRRKKVLEETDKTKATGTKKFNYHHVRQIAGGVPLTSDDVMIIDQKINSKLGGKVNESLNRISAAIQKNNRLALEAMNVKNEGAALDYMKRSDELNAQAEKIVNSAIDDLPEKYKGSVGFNQFTLPRNEYGFPISNEPMIIKKIGGMPVSKDAVDLTTLDLKQEKEFRKIVKAQAEAGKTGKINLEKITQDLGTLGCPKGLPAASGGRIKFDKGGACVLKGKKKLKLGLTNGFDKTEGELAKKILQAGKGLKNMVALRNILGPAAIGFTVAAEAGLVGYDMLATGKSFKEAVGASLFNYALGDKTKIDNKKLRYQGYADAGVSENQIGKISAFENAMDEMNNTFAEFDEENRLYNIAANQKGKGRMDPTRFKKIKQQQAENFYNQADKNKALIQDLARTQTEDRLDKALDPMVPALMSDADAKRKAMQMTKPSTVGFGNVMDTIFPSGFFSGTTYKEDRDKAINYMPEVQEYYRGNRFAKGGLSGGDTSGPPPESGPMSQGLRSLYKNGRKL